MKAFERIIEQALPPLNPSVIWLNTSKNPSALYHFKDGKWCPMSDIDFSTIIGDNPNANLSVILERLDFTFETVSESLVRSMWGSFHPYIGTEGFLVDVSTDNSGYILLEAMDMDNDGYLIMYNY